MEICTTTTLTLLAIVVTFFAILLYRLINKWSNNATQFYRDADIPYIPALKSNWQMASVFLFGHKPYVDLQTEQCEQYGKAFGKIDMGRTNLVITDSALIRDVMVKQFNCFYDRPKIPNIFTSKIFERTLFFERAERWRHIRAVVSPTFSSAKMRHMDTLVRECLAELRRDLDERLSTKKILEVDAENFLQEFVLNVVGSAFFGFSPTAMNKSLFIEHARVLIRPPRLSSILLFFLVPFGSLRTWLTDNGYIGMPPASLKFFENFVPNVIRQRREQPSAQQRRDFLNLLINASAASDQQQDGVADSEENTAPPPILPNGDAPTTESSEQQQQQKKLNDEEIAAQCLIFLLAGFTTTSMTAACVLHELAVHTDIQERVRAEVNAVVGGGESPAGAADCAMPTAQLNYDTVSRMPLLEACVNETLRLYPPLAIHERECMQDCTLQSNGMHVRKGVTIVMPVWYLHRSAENFQDPEKFDPDRFFEPERRAQIDPYTFLPFGTGPRNCVANRFAMMELKMLIALLVMYYRVVRVASTVDPLKLKTRTGGLVTPVRTPIGLEKL